MQFSLVKGLLARNSNSLSLKNTLYWTIANLNFTQSKHCTIIIKNSKVSAKSHVRKVPRQNTILCALKISVICPDFDDRFINCMKYN